MALALKAFDSKYSNAKPDKAALDAIQLVKSWFLNC